MVNRRYGFHTPPARSFSINGQRLANSKTSFAAGLGLLHWSILEGELRHLSNYDTSPNGWLSIMYYSSVS